VDAQKDLSELTKISELERWLRSKGLSKKEAREVIYKANKLRNLSNEITY